MLMRRFVQGLGSLVLTIVGTGMVFGQDYPNRPIRIVTGPIGGGSDFVARLMAQGISGPLRQPVIIDNRPNQTVGIVLSKALPDGYTLLVAGSGFLLGPLMQDAPYDALRDFAPISMLTAAPNILVVHPTVPAKSVKELIALAKAKPGTLNYSMGAIGGITHLSAELFKSMAGVNIVRVSYKGTGPGLIALVSGEVQLSFSNITSVMPHVKLDKLRALAVTSAQPSELAPGLPTVASAGLPGYEATAADSILAPAKTPTAIITRLNQESVRTLRTPEVKARFLEAGVETVGNSPDEFAALLRAHIAKWGKVIKEANIRAE